MNIHLTHSVVQAPNEPFSYIFNLHVIRKEPNEHFPYAFNVHVIMEGSK